MKITECAHPSRYFSASVSPRDPHFIYFSCQWQI